MRRILQISGLAIVQFFFCINANSQTLAVTEKGDTIYVYNNGTWSYEYLDAMPPLGEMNFLDRELKIDTISTDFMMSKAANKEVGNKEMGFKLKYDASKWKRVPAATLNNDAEFGFEFKQTDIWCIVISEETQIDPDMLMRIAIKTMEENTGLKVDVLKAESRKVNGTEVIRGVVNAKYSGISFIFDTYYFSNEKGSVQISTWTGETIWNKYKDEINDFMNGFVVE